MNTGTECKNIRLSLEYVQICQLKKREMFVITMAVAQRLNFFPRKRGLTFATQKTSCLTSLESMKHIRNIAIIAHVDHGKTTPSWIACSSSPAPFRANQHESSRRNRLMDSMDLEKEKGITIRAKNAAFKYKRLQHQHRVDNAWTRGFRRRSRTHHEHD